MDCQKRARPAVEIVFCMGSSCFSRGSNHGLSRLQAYLKSNELEKRVTLRGQLCQGRCQKGPNITINDVVYPAVSASAVLDLVKYHLEQQAPGDSQP